MALLAAGLIDHNIQPTQTVRRIVDKQLLKRPLLLSRAESETARAAAEQARVRAEKAKRREAKSRRQANDAALQAQAAEAQAEAAGKKLAALLENEKKRVEELEAQTRGVKIIPDVTMH